MKSNCVILFVAAVLFSQLVVMAASPIKGDGNDTKVRGQFISIRRFITYIWEEMTRSIRSFRRVLAGVWTVLKKFRFYSQKFAWFSNNIQNSVAIVFFSNCEVLHSINKNNSHVNSCFFIYFFYFQYCALFYRIKHKLQITFRLSPTGMSETKILYNYKVLCMFREFSKIIC